jgi:hypothetical protein
MGVFWVLLTSLWIGGCVLKLLPVLTLHHNANVSIVLVAFLYVLQAQFSGQPMDVITRDTDRDFFMSPQEAIEYGLIDAIISKPQVLPQREAVAA